MKTLPRATLASWPTPLEEAPRLAEALGLRTLYVKRDDLTGLGLGGNKVRKLEYLLGEAIARGADTVVTTAGGQSNFLRLTAVAARRLGLRPILVVRGARPASLQGNLLLMHLAGADLRFVDTADAYDPSTVALMREIGEQVEAAGHHPYLIHLGTFSGGLAAVGYVTGGLELVDQCRAAGISRARIVVAVGSGGTYAGLLLGLHVAGVGFHTVGASVMSPVPFLRARVREKVQAAAEILGVRTTLRDEEIDITDALIGEGYATPPGESLDAVYLAARTEGLILDPIYTGRALAALRRAARAGAIRDDETPVFVHTGGAPNVFAHAERLSAHGAVTS
jgi:D-cysteine desulfhydrase family pyridoxal phosphate-dependent enzyme